MVGLIVSGLSKAVGGYFEHSAKKAKAKSDLKIAEIDAKVYEIINTGNPLGQ